MRHGVYLVGRALSRVREFLRSGQKLGRVCISVLQNSRVTYEKYKKKNIFILNTYYTYARKSHLSNIFEMLVTLLIDARLLQIATDTRVLSDKDFTVIRQPIENLFDILLE